MNRLLQITEDGSHTFYLSELDEPFHSMHGALQESEHVFIHQGLSQLESSSSRRLELGVGTGLNVVLTLRESLKKGATIHFHTVEKFPLTPSEYLKLNYESFIKNVPEGTLLKLHQAPWGEESKLTPNFTLHKEQSDIRTMQPEGYFDLVYFDAFAPDKQPELWTETIFSKIADMTGPGAVLVTYSSKGVVRRALKSCGFLVKKVPGPPGKREMIRAIRI